MRHFDDGVPRLTGELPNMIGMSIVRAVSRQDLTPENSSVDYAASQLSDSSRQVGWRSQLMVS